MNKFYPIFYYIFIDKSKQSNFLKFKSVESLAYKCI